MIILLNGTSSSGKSCIASELRQILSDPFFLFGVDQFLQESLPKNINFERDADFALVQRAIAGFNNSLRPLAASIDHLIIDHVIDKPTWLKDISSSLNGFETFFVGVKAPLEILEERERSRSNRKVGTARAQFEYINSLKYDDEVDTSRLTPLEAALKIKANLRRGSALQVNAVGAKIAGVSHGRSHRNYCLI